VLCNVADTPLAKIEEPAGEYGGIFIGHGVRDDPGPSGMSRA